MPYETLDIPLLPSPVGTRRSIRMVRFGQPEARPKAYIHGGLHADEAPGMMTAHRLIDRLETAERQGAIRGQVVVVPCANPIGLAQYVHHHQSGRHELASGMNFNRGWPDLSNAVSQRVAGRLGKDANENAALIGAAWHEALEASPPMRELDALRMVLARESCDADLVLDLHCDDEALVHLFLMASQWPAARDLAGDLGCRAVLLADNPGGVTFIESVFAPWSRLALAFPDYPIPQPSLTATVELRGLADTSEELASADAAALFSALQRRGFVAGDPGDPPDGVPEATGLDSCDIVRTPVAGLVDYRVGLGEEIARDDVVAEIIDPMSGPGASRHAVRSATDGLVLSRRLHKLVAPGDVLAKIVGDEPLAHRRGYLLED